MNRQTLIKFDPKPSDVVCTRKKKWTDEHVGNQEFQSRLETYRHRMQTTTSPSKLEVESMVEEIVDFVFKQNGRFLKPDQVNSDYCEEMTIESVSQFVESALRNMRLNFQKKTAVAVTNPTVVKRPYKTKARHQLESASASTAVLTTPKRRGRPPKVAKQNHAVVVTQDKLGHKNNDKEEEEFEPDDHSEGGSIVLASYSRYQHHVAPAPIVSSSHPVELVSAVAKTHRKSTTQSHQKSTHSKRASRPPPPPTQVPAPAAAQLQAYSKAVKNVSCNWTYNKLYETTDSDNDNHNNNKLYGNAEDQILFRQWINAQMLPQAVADLLADFGVRNIKDVVLLMETAPDSLNGLATLDATKLRRAVQSLQNQPETKRKRKVDEEEAVAFADEEEDDDESLHYC